MFELLHCVKLAAAGQLSEAAVDFGSQRLRHNHSVTHVHTYTAHSTHSTCMRISISPKILKISCNILQESLSISAQLPLVTYDYDGQSAHDSSFSPPARQLSRSRNSCYFLPRGFHFVPSTAPYRVEHLTFQTLLPARGLLRVGYHLFRINCHLRSNSSI